MEWMRLKRQVVRCLAVAAALLSTLMLGACNDQPTVPEIVDSLPRVSAAAVSQPYFQAEAGQSLSWRSEVLWVGNDGADGYRNTLTDLDIAREVEAQLTEQGLRFSSEPETDYTVIAVVVIGEPEDNAALRELARLYPSLAQVAYTLERGSLMLAVGHPGSPVTLWRGSVQTFITRFLPHDLRQERLSRAVRSLVKTLPLSTSHAHAEKQ